VIGLRQPEATHRNEEVTVKGIKRFQLARLATFALAFSFFAACEDDPTSSVPPDVDPAETQAALESVVQQFFTDNQGLTSLETFGAAIGGAIPSIAQVNLTLSPESPTFHGVAERFRQSMADLYARNMSGPVLMAGIPVDLHGTTFEYNPTSLQYEPTERAGAPTDGIRFILYDNVTALNEVGHLDLIDKSNFEINPATINITFAVIITDISTVTPVVSYGVTGTVSETGGTLLVTGFLSDGTDQLDFDFQVSGSETTGFNADFTLSVENVLAININLGETPTGTATFEASISDGAHEILFILTIAANGDLLGGSGIFFDQILVATFTGNIEQDTVQLNNAQGDPLTQQELIALANIFVALEQAFVVMEGLFAFGLGLVGVIFFF
jgi:hypothetical protein